jgi:hypothetical protein
VSLDAPIGNIISIYNLKYYVQFEGEREESPARQDAVLKGQSNTQGNTKNMTKASCCSSDLGQFCGFLAQNNFGRFFCLVLMPDFLTVKGLVT